MAKRPSYKAKWKEAIENLKNEIFRANTAEYELERWRSAGAIAGRKILEPIELVGSSPITFEAIEYLCACAFMESHARVTYPNGGYSQSYVWKGHLLQSKA